MKQTFSKRPHKNLVQSIREAESEQEITELMQLGATFESASDKTRSRWHEASKVRLGELKEGKCS